MRTFRKSAGTLCTAPAEIAFLVMGFILQSFGTSLKPHSGEVLFSQTDFFRNPTSWLRVYAYLTGTEPDWNMPRARKRVIMAANSKPIAKITQRYFRHCSP
jgi:hypothetical protein